MKILTLAVTTLFTFGLSNTVTAHDLAAPIVQIDDKNYQLSFEPLNNEAGETSAGAYQISLLPVADPDTKPICDATTSHLKRCKPKTETTIVVPAEGTDGNTTIANPVVLGGNGGGFTASEPTFRTDEFQNYYFHFRLNGEQEIKVPLQPDASQYTPSQLLTKLGEGDTSFFPENFESMITTQKAN